MEIGACVALITLASAAFNIHAFVAITEDPVYFSGPHIETNGYERDGSVLQTVGPPCAPGFEGASGEVPHFRPG